uniref:Uncharacterized protein n=1 Tax=Octactis speculum TaxID=3111310 RepID=A0A7S2AQ08_9STRA
MTMPPTSSSDHGGGPNEKEFGEEQARQVVGSGKTSTVPPRAISTDDGSEGGQKRKEGDGKDTTPAPSPKAGSAQAKAVEEKPNWFRRKMDAMFYKDATRADLGKKNEAYYDDNLKRWVFPGEDTAGDAAGSVAPPPGPPMMTSSVSSPSFGSKKNDDQPSKPSESDPLAMLMAPPTMRRAPTTVRSRYVDPFAAMQTQSKPGMPSVSSEPSLPLSEGAAHSAVTKKPTPPVAGTSSVTGGGPPMFFNPNA